MVVGGPGTKGWLENLELFGNKGGGVLAWAGGNPTLSGCILRDHNIHATQQKGTGMGLCVAASSRDQATVGPGNVFTDNRAGNIVRE